VTYATAFPSPVHRVPNVARRVRRERGERSRREHPGWTAQSSNAPDELCRQYAIRPSVKAAALRLAPARRRRGVFAWADRREDERDRAAAMMAAAATYGRALLGSASLNNR